MANPRRDPAPRDPAPRRVVDTIPFDTMHPLFIHNKAARLAAVAEVEDVQTVDLHTEVSYLLLENCDLKPTTPQATIEMMSALKAALWDESAGRLKGVASKGTLRSLDQLVCPSGRKWKQSFRLLLGYNGHAAGTRLFIVQAGVGVGAGASAGARDDDEWVTAADDDDADEQQQRAVVYTHSKKTGRVIVAWASSVQQFAQDELPYYMIKLPADQQLPTDIEAFYTELRNAKKAQHGSQKLQQLNKMVHPFSTNWKGCFKLLCSFDGHAAGTHLMAVLVSARGHASKHRHPPPHTHSLIHFCCCCVHRVPGWRRRRPRQ